MSVRTSGGGPLNQCCGSQRSAAAAAAASVPRKYRAIAPAPAHLRQVPPYMRNAPAAHAPFPCPSLRHGGRMMSPVMMPDHPGNDGPSWLMNEVGCAAEPWDSFSLFSNGDLPPQPSPSTPYPSSSICPGDHHHHYRHHHRNHHRHHYCHGGAGGADKMTMMPPDADAVCDWSQSPGPWQGGGGGGMMMMPPDADGAYDWSQSPGPWQVGGGGGMMMMPPSAAANDWCQSSGRWHGDGGFETGPAGFLDLDKLYDNLMTAAPLARKQQAAAAFCDGTRAGRFSSPSPGFFGGGWGAGERSLRHLLSDIDDGYDGDAGSDDLDYHASPEEINFLEQQTFGLSLEDMCRAYAAAFGRTGAEGGTGSRLPFCADGEEAEDAAAATALRSREKARFGAGSNGGGCDGGDQQQGCRLRPSPAPRRRSSKESAVTSAKPRSPVDVPDAANPEAKTTTTTTAAAAPKFVAAGWKSPAMASTALGGGDAPPDARKRKKAKQPAKVSGQAAAAPAAATASTTTSSSFASSADGGAVAPKKPAGTPMEKKYQCPVCPKRFSRPSARVAHLRVHTGEKPYSCPKCERPFSVDSNMVRHCKTHDNARPRKRKGAPAPAPPGDNAGEDARGGGGGTKRQRNN